MISIGEMDRLCTLQSLTKSKTAAGAPSNTYATYCTEWAKRETMSISEEVAGRRISILEKYKYTMHYNSAIDETYRLVDDSVTYNILSVEKLPGYIFMELIVEKLQT